MQERDVGIEKLWRFCAQAVAAAKKAWGRRLLSEADAEDRLAFACERAPCEEAVTAQLRAAFQVLHCSWPASPIVQVQLTQTTSFLQLLPLTSKA